MFALAAVILFILAALGVNNAHFNLVDIGLACVALHLLIGAWPFGAIIARRD